MVHLHLLLDTISKAALRERSSPAKTMLTSNSGILCGGSNALNTNPSAQGCTSCTSPSATSSPLARLSTAPQTAPFKTRLSTAAESEVLSYPFPGTSSTTTCPMRCEVISSTHSAVGSTPRLSPQSMSLSENALCVLWSALTPQLSICLPVASSE